MKYTTWTGAFEADPMSEDLVLQWPTEFLQQEDWRAGDVIRFEALERGGLMLVNLTKQGRIEALPHA